MFISDEPFFLIENMMKPYSKHCAGYDEHIFNYRLSCARQVVKNAFGILASKFRIFLKSLIIKVEHLDSVVMASCVLHNFLKRKSSTYYISENQLDKENLVTGKIVQGQLCQNGEMVSLQRTSSYIKTVQKSSETNLRSIIITKKSIIPR